MTRFDSKDKETQQKSSKTTTTHTHVDLEKQLRNMVYVRVASRLLLPTWLIENELHCVELATIISYNLQHSVAAYKIRSTDFKPRETNSYNMQLETETQFRKTKIWHLLDSDTMDD